MMLPFNKVSQALSTFSLHLIPIFVLCAPRQIFIPFFLVAISGALNPTPWKASLLGMFILPFGFLLTYTFVSLISSFFSPLALLQIPIACKGILLVSGFGLSLMAPAPRITVLFWGTLSLLFICIAFLPWVLPSCSLYKVYLFIFERQEFSALFGIISIASLFLWGPKIGRLGTVFLLILSILMLAQWRVRASIFGFIGALGFFILAWIFSKARPWLTRDLLTASLIPLGLSPLWLTRIFPPDPSSFFFQILDLSFQHRVYLWEFFLSLASQKFWLGWGAGLGGQILETLSPMVASTYLPLVGYKPDVSVPSILSWINLDNLHPHNFFLQAYVEGGVIGYLCLLASLVSLLAKAPAAPGLKTVLWGCVAVYIALPISVSFSLLSTWWLSGLFLLPFLCRAYTNHS